MVSDAKVDSALTYDFYSRPIYARSIPPTEQLEQSAITRRELSPAHCESANVCRIKKPPSQPKHQGCGRHGVDYG